MSPESGIIMFPFCNSTAARILWSIGLSKISNDFAFLHLPILAMLGRRLFSMLAAALATWRVGSKSAILQVLTRESTSCRKWWSEPSSRIRN